MTAKEFNFLKETILPVINELKESWHNEKDEEMKDKLGYKLTIANKAWYRIEEAYDKDYQPF